MTASQEQIKYIQNLGHQVRKLVCPSDRTTKLILDIYHPSLEVPGDVKDGNSQIDSLKSLALKIIFKNYKGKPLHEYIQWGDKIWLGENLDIEMKLEDVIGLDNEIYWRRVAESCCNDKLALLAARRDKKCYWKAFGVECKFTEMIENMSPEKFLEEKFIPLVKQVSSFITNLNIKQMRPLKSELVKKSIYNPKYVYMNYPCDLCDHLNIGAIVAELSNLTTLSLQYGLQKCEYDYQRRYFEISYEDVANLAKGISTLSNLKSFRFQHTRLDDEKLRLLTKGLVQIPSLEKLDLIYCNLKNDSGKSLAYLLENNKTLKSLNLKGNEIESSGCQSIGYGLQKRSKVLEFLGLSRCPIGFVGVLGLGGGIKGSNHCPKLDFSFCSVGKVGAMHIAEMFEFQKHIVSLNIAGIPLGFSGGETLIQNIETCFYLTELECRSCELTRGQESKLRILVERNRFYRDHPFLLKTVFTERDEDEIEDLLEIKRQTDLNNLYANCELLNPSNEVYPETLDGMTSTLIPDVPEEFLKDFDTNPQNIEMKLVLSNKKQ